MKKYLYPLLFPLVMFALILSFAKTVSAEMLLPIVSVYDGDTIKTYIPLPTPLNKMSIRLLGIDTPENPAASYAVTGKLGRASCVKEAELALEAKAVVKTMADGAPYMTVDDYKWGKYGGRIVGKVYIEGIDVAAKLIQMGLAVEYNGGKKTKDWCIQ